MASPVFEALIREGIHLPEALLLSVGLALSGALVWCVGAQWITLQAIVLLLGYACTVALYSAGSRLRLLVNYLAAWVLYAGSSSVVEALHLPLHHEVLQKWDVWFFGEPPAIIVQEYLTPWMNDVLSLGYLSYHVYLHWAFIEAFLKSSRWRNSFGRFVLTAFGLGFSGYYLFPAAPPLAAFPELFETAVAGHWLTRLNESVNSTLAARYDAFPSLHLLVTLALLTWDWHCQRRRFWIMLLPSALMVLATLALRLHYASDLLASVILYIALLVLVKPSTFQSNECIE